MRRLKQQPAKAASRPAQPGKRRAAASPRRAQSRTTIRRRPTPWWRMALTRYCAGLAAVCLVGGGIGWAWQSGWIAQTWATAVAGVVAASADAGLAVRQVLVEGREETASEDLMAALQVSRGEPILALAPTEIKARLEALPWIRSATVERRLPDILYLKLEEFEPMALWQRSQELVLVSRSGEVIPVPKIAPFGNLPVIVGDGAPAHAPGLFEMLALEPDLGRRVVAAVRVSGRRWNLRLDSGTDIELPETGAAAAWQRLARLDREHGVLARDVMTVDLRLPDRLVVRLSPETAARYRAPANNT
jgi:cell division protein FtsQ